MKKKYNTPEIQTYNIQCEQVFMGSDLNIGIDNDHNITDETEMWSNEESDLNVWN